VGKLPVRKNIRLKGYDYSQNGAYFLTICTQDKRMLFGNVVGADSISARMEINDCGQMIDDTLHEIFNEIQNVILDKYVIMPNHIHVVAVMSRADMESAPTISYIMQSFKRYTTIKYINGVKTGMYSKFNKRIWQRSFHDHIIRNEAEYQRIWQYIDENPLKWQDDCYYINSTE
jgi:REP element-mobilizing transposase RayT